MARKVSALAAGVLVAAAGAAYAQSGEVSFTIGVMNWRGSAAIAPVEIVNTTGGPMRPTEMNCEFVAVGRVVGTDRQPVPPLAPGARVTINVSAETGGQLVDSIRCRLQ